MYNTKFLRMNNSSSSSRKRKERVSGTGYAIIHHRQNSKKKNPIEIRTPRSTALRSVGRLFLIPDLLGIVAAYDHAPQGELLFKLDDAVGDDGSRLQIITADGAVLKSFRVRHIPCHMTVDYKNRRIFLASALCIYCYSFSGKKLGIIPACIASAALLTWDEWNQELHVVGRGAEHFSDNLLTVLSIPPNFPEVPVSFMSRRPLPFFVSSFAISAARNEHYFITSIDNLFVCRDREHLPIRAQNLGSTSGEKEEKEEKDLPRVRLDCSICIRCCNHGKARYPRSFVTDGSVVYDFCSVHIRGLQICHSGRGLLYVRAKRHGRSRLEVYSPEGKFLRAIPAGTDTVWLFTL